MPPSAVPSLNARDFFALAPEIVLSVWGLLVLLADVTVFRNRSAARRQQIAAYLALVGAALALVAALLPMGVRFDIYNLSETLNISGHDYLANPDPVILFGTVADDLLTSTMNVALIAMLGLVIWMSTSWSFTEDWGEYFALLLWSTVGMMLLMAAEELLTLFLTLETMTICLYILTACEKTRRRSPEAGLKYFVYGSVSSALFLFGLSMIYGLCGSTRFDAIRYVIRPTVYTAGTVGLHGNLAGATAILLMLVGFGFKVAAVPFHQWAPDAYEGAPAPVTAWIATGSKLASFIALTKVLVYALGPWASDWNEVLSPGWIGMIVVLAAASMTYGNLAALAQRNLKRMLAYSSIAHAGYMLVGVAAAGVSVHQKEAAGAVLFYLIIYAFSNIGAFAVAAWLAREKRTDDIVELNGLAYRYPGLATCILLLMLSLIGMPPLAGFFGKLYMFMEALDQGGGGAHWVTLAWLVGLGLLNSVISAFYYVRVMKAMFLRDPGKSVLAPAPRSIAVPIVLATLVVVAFGVYPAPLMDMMKGAAVPMLMSSARESVGTDEERAKGIKPGPATPPAPGPVVPTSPARGPVASPPLAPPAAKP